MAQRSILSMFKKTNVQDTTCRPGKPLSKSRTADPTFTRLGEPVQDTICRPGKPSDTLLESRTAEPTDDDILFLSEKLNTDPTFNKDDESTDLPSKSRISDPTSNLSRQSDGPLTKNGQLKQVNPQKRRKRKHRGEHFSKFTVVASCNTTHQYIRPRCANNGRIYAVQYNDAGYQHTYK